MFSSMRADLPDAGLTLELSGGVAVRLERNVRRLRRSMLGRQRSAPLEQPTPPKLPALKAQACDDAARKAATAMDNKPARSWAKRTIRRTNTSYRLTLELSGGAAVRLNEMLDGCDEVRWGEAVGLDERRAMSRRPHKLPALKAEDLPRRCVRCRCGDKRQASAKLGETHATKNQHELPTNA